MIVGDVTSTMACSIVAQKMYVKVAHVDAGIRLGDWSMPEEINRLVTNRVTIYFFTTTEVTNTSLRNSGISDDRIFWVGNTMIDTLLKPFAFYETCCLGYNRFTGRKLYCYDLAWSCKRG